MSNNPRLPTLPYVLLGAMSVASFGGPFLIVAVLSGGASDRAFRRLRFALLVVRPGGADHGAWNGPPWFMKTIICCAPLNKELNP